ncbi:HNH endonuclease [Pseudomonas abietaniphila]|uniref:HNH endonuclease n=1 Tax=Pseudomonas abietaniphila TaxID=89065 RepID=UPI00078405CE|nr:HNH endonuclease signature motif containing protein [Pseudomonas abietaniphila]
MALTAKQQRFVDEALSEKISALRKIAMHIGMIAPCNALSISKAEQGQRFIEYGFEPASKALAVLRSKDATPQAKAACGLILEFFVPDWKDIYGPELYGQLLERDDSQVLNWRAAVLARDEYKCRRCESTESLHAHHIVRWADCPELRVELSNGMTLCKSCHEAEHAKTR